MSARIALTIMCLATRLSMMSARAIFNLRTVNGSVENRATRLRRWGQTIVTTDEIPDPHKLSIKLVLNGETMQDSNTDQLIFGVPELIEFLSRDNHARAGRCNRDWHASGVGFARKPPVFLKPGDEMEVDDRRRWAV